MNSNNLAVIVPVEQTADAASLKKQVWSTVTGLLTKYLGKYYGSFFPMRKAWDCDIENGFGIVLGRERPLDFLSLYAGAHELQQKSQAFHISFLLKEIEKWDKGSHVIPIVVGEENKSLMFHIMWKVLAEEGIVLPDYGLFYTEQNKAFISEKEEERILSHIADYAICVVQIAALEDDHA